jgi:hypothetical protein
MSEATSKTRLRGQHAGYSYTWVTLPPIRELERGADVEKAMAELRRSFEAYMTNPGLDTKDGTLPSSFTINAGTSEEETFQLPNAADWNNRIESTRTLIGMVKSGNELNLAYYCFGIVVGMVCVLKTDEYFYVADLVTHPGAANAGEILIEEVCNRGQKAGCGGKIQLYSLNKQSTGFYLSIGFVVLEGSTLALDPSGNSCWSNLNGRWCLKKHAGESYMLAPPPLPTRPPVKR